MSPKQTNTTVNNPLRTLADHGQSVWFDYIKRSLVDSGELARLIERDDLRGVTSNPAIFEKAIAGSTDYAADLMAAGARCASETKAVYEELAIRDIQGACDVMSVVYRRTGRKDGYVSLEVSPKLARDTQGTLAEARRLWKAVARPNLMIKVPATSEGVPAVRTLISEGINVNVTLLFAVSAYAAVAEAYLSGLAAWAKKGGDVGRVASVASFFVSRIDSLVDGELDRRAESAATSAQRALAESLLGKTAIANAKLAYEHYERVVLADKRWKALAKQGAMPQRLLWASTSTKDPRWRDVVYVEELIGPDTVNTTPPATYEAFRDHGRPRTSLREGVDDARGLMGALATLGISIDAVTAQLLDDGVRIFDQAFDKLLAAIASQARVPNPRLVAALPIELASEVKQTLLAWKKDKIARLWAKDQSLWTGGDEDRWLGWLTITERQLAEVDQLETFAKEVKRAGLKHVIVLGMGGSSLCPEVLRFTFGKVKGFPELHVLDSTDPAQVKSFEKRIDYASTLFIVASKSGSTLEPNIFKQYFFEQAKKKLGAERAGRQFVAITDPGSKMQQVAESDRFGRVFFGDKSIGGRYSALSHFGLVPAAAMGLDVRALLERADRMKRACQDTDPEANPGVKLGAILGAAARGGRDKVTIVTSQSIARLGAWLEQLIAESTGKLGQALIPVDGEPLGPPEVYGKDRVFVHLVVAGDDDDGNARALSRLEAAGHAIVRIRLADTLDIAAEFFRWEIATAVAGAVLGIHPFDQPDVEASKLATKKLTTAFEEHGSLPAETPIWKSNGIALYADPRNAAELAAQRPSDLAGWLAAHFDRVGTGDYIALLAYVEMKAEHEGPLAELRQALRDKKHVATCLGFGPRFLHSTGQAYKGGPNTGVVLQVTCDDAKELAVPGQKYGFGVVKSAQARGDFEVLSERGRRALRVHLSKDVTKGLAGLRDAVVRALA